MLVLAYRAERCRAEQTLDPGLVRARGPLGSLAAAGHPFQLELALQCIIT